MSRKKEGNKILKVKVGYKRVVGLCSSLTLVLRIEEILILEKKKGFEIVYID
ncbi:MULTISPECIES: hypothetical protein [Flavobacterium]|uniref:Uncharacterized protein n=1 Tax=Flavobacterium covae TaxID=2906076 RepID=A0ABW8PGA3_9FLAO|nr:MULTISPECIES: hypothetical protein [Flavobacterium]MCH4830924.1 hypothetical protein [Flavobacterium columnare]MCH4833135.1 hypothetical protein [Flavobacterium columnare]MCJ1807376.1 hypothetical protein [Flavobacterium covae]MCJ1810142.1 hypothetical protein [Flavobacterium covae]